MKENDHKIKKVLTALKSDESLLDCIIEMIDTVNDDQAQLETGDDAEEAVVSVIHKAGNTLLQKWVHKKTEEAETLAAANRGVRPHQKKRSVGTPLLET